MYLESGRDVTRRNSSVHLALFDCLVVLLLFVTENACAHRTTERVGLPCITRLHDSITKSHERNQLVVTLPTGEVCDLKSREQMAIPSGVTLWHDVKLLYTLAQPSIYSQETEDDDPTDDAAPVGDASPYRLYLGAETQPSS